jgi:hypothetical protein
MMYLSGALLQGRLLALLVYIRLGWEGLPGTIPPTFYKNSEIMTVKSFITH